MLEDILEVFGLKGGDTKAYKSLLEFGSVPVGTLAKNMGVPRTTLYGNLERLYEQGLVAKSIQKGITLYTAEPLEKIDLIYQKRIESLKKKQYAAKKLIPELEAEIGIHRFKPKIRQYEGQHELQAILEDMLLLEDIETLAFWPIDKMMDVMQDDFTHYHNKERIKRNISIRVVWPHQHSETTKKWPYLSVGSAFLREARLAPLNINFNMGYWIYGTKVAFVSSRAETFGFIVDSQEYTDLMRSQFEVMWNISNPYTFESPAADLFLESVKHD